MLEQSPNFFVNVCIMENCRFFGAEKTLKKLREGLSDTNVKVNERVCFGACNSGPNVEFTRQPKVMEEQVRLAFFNRVGWWRMFGGTRIQDVITAVKEGIISNTSLVRERINPIWEVD